MLKRLCIENLALIETVELEFEPGLTALTGETGAGKSVIVNALALALGARADREYVRHGADTCRVEAVFDLDSVPPALRRECGLDEACSEATITRTISNRGESTVSINGCRTSLTKLRPLVDNLGEILGQHANQVLMNPANHLPYLDGQAGIDGLAEEVGEFFRNWHKAKADLKRLEDRRAQLKERRELLRFQQQEITRANIEGGEEDRLIAERRRLDSARNLMESSQRVVEAIDGEEPSVLQMLGQVCHELETMAKIDHEVQSSVEEADSARILLEELRRSVESYGGSITDDPARLEEVNARLDELYSLKKKYGGSEEAILESLSRIEAELGDNPDVDEQIAEARTRVGDLFEEYSALATKLSLKRRKSAAKLEKKVIAELARLAIKGARIEFTFESESDPDGVEVDGRKVAPGEQGLETMYLSFSANPGEPLRPLVKTASGGEISRVLLALTATRTGSSGSQSRLLILDEIDAGIGGETANRVAEKLKDMSKTAQILVVSHLHQIARRADQHLAVAKIPASDNRPVISVTPLTGEQVADELDRMLALPD